MKSQTLCIALPEHVKRIFIYNLYITLNGCNEMNYGGKLPQNPGRWMQNSDCPLWLVVLKSVYQEQKWVGMMVGLIIKPSLPANTGRKEHHENFVAELASTDAIACMQVLKF